MVTNSQRCVDESESPSNIHESDEKYTVSTVEYYYFCSACHFVSVIFQYDLTRQYVG